MKAGTVLLAALAAWLVARWAARGVRAASADRLPAGVSAPDPELRALAPHLHDDVIRRLREFRARFLAGCAGGGGDVVADLQTLRADVLAGLYELRMRLPNDLDAEARLTRHIEDTDSLLLAYVGEARARCGRPMLHPGPIDDAFYRRFYRAANDSWA